MTKKDLKVTRQATNGLREGINKEDLIKSLTEDDYERIKLWKQLGEKEFNNDDAFKCGVHSDQMFVQFLEKVNVIRQSTRLIGESAQMTNKNKIDLAKKETKRTWGDTGNEMTLRDLEIENVKLNILIDKNLSELRIFLYDIYQYVGLQRIDREVFFTEEDYTKLMNETKMELVKDGIDLYKKAII